ncbi:MAG: aspartate dehydrogenase [Burkholderiales bacterium]
MKRFALLGYGAIAEEMLRCLEEAGELDALAGVLVRRAHPAEARFALVRSIDALLDLGADMVVECAGHDAMRQYGPVVLAHGTDLLCASVGVLADPGFEALLGEPAARLWIPSGAVAGIDGLLAARSAGLRRVTYTSVKPPPAWKGTPGESRIGPGRTVFFEGSARQAALQFPQNANVGATVALAGLGLDRTTVRLVSDPDARGPLGIIEAQGDFGSLRFEILAYASARNPKTSLLTAHSLLLALREGFCFDFFASVRRVSA